MESRHHLRSLRVLLQGCGSRLGFFHQRGVLLRALIHLCHGLVDLLDAVGLLAAGLADFF